MDSFRDSRIIFEKVNISMYFYFLFSFVTVLLSCMGAILV